MVERNKRSSHSSFANMMSKIPSPSCTTLSSAQMTNDASPMSLFQPHWDLYPKSYTARKISSSNSSLLDQLDGDLTKDVWKAVPWSDAFADIQGPQDAPQLPEEEVVPVTRFKAVWDDDYLYIGALLHTANFATHAEFTHRNDPIFQKDSDFEVFVDPFGSCHNYKELEVNAINTVWNLLLDRPYADGGTEHSGRIARPGTPQYYDVTHQKTATKVVDGSLNDPSGRGATWSVEMALSYKDVLARIVHDDPSSKRPRVGHHWRINFSRVEKQGAINWTWQPQVTWDPDKKRFAGFVDMHRPDAWGYLVFGDEHGNAVDVSTPPTDHNQQQLEARLASPLPRDPSWPVRLAAMTIYYAQHAYYNKHGAFCYEWSDLVDLIPTEIVDPFDITILKATKQKKDTVEYGFRVIVAPKEQKQRESLTLPSSSIAVIVSDDRLIKERHWKGSDTRDAFLQEQ